MHLSTVFFASIFAALAAAQNPFTMATIPVSIPAGSTYNITWSPTTKGTVSLWLVQAAGQGSTNVHYVSTIAANLTNSGGFAWEVPNSIPKGSFYALEIVSDTNPTIMNYSGQFAIDSTTTSSASESASSTATATVKSSSGSTSATSSATSGSTTGTSSITTGSSSSTASQTSSSSSITTSALKAAAVETARAGMGMLAVVGVAILAL